MVRFARAEGSKGFNKRTLEDATPWSEMVAQRTKKVKVKDTEPVKENTEPQSIDEGSEQLKDVIETQLEENEGNSKAFRALPSNSEETEKKKKKRKKKKDETSVQNPNPGFTYNSEGERIKVFKDGAKRTWFDLPYEESKRMTRFEGMWVKREMAEKLQELKNSLKEENADGKILMKKMMKAKRKAHRELRIELIYEQKRLVKNEKPELDESERSSHDAQAEKKKKAKKSKKKKDKRAESTGPDNSENVCEERLDFVEIESSMYTSDYKKEEESSDSTSENEKPNTKDSEDITLDSSVHKDVSRANASEDYAQLEQETEDVDTDRNQYKTYQVNDFNNRKKEFQQNQRMGNKNNVFGQQRGNIPSASSHQWKKQSESLTFEENSVMTLYDGFWVKRSAVQKLDRVKADKLRNIYDFRVDGNKNRELTDSEQIQFQRAMKREKRVEHRYLVHYLRNNPNGGYQKEEGANFVVRQDGLNNNASVKEDTAEDSSSSSLEVVMFDGFWVKKESADRLHKLRKRLMSEGVTGEELRILMQKERRKEERLLKNERKLVCLKCRNPGHMVSACPQLAEEGSGGQTEICYTCGSTEHTSRTCSLKPKGAEFSHAVCFICNEAGHISRECPDNPRGLYPRGGACRGCGSVEHLAKDCPDLIKAKEQDEVKLGCIDAVALEALDLPNPVNVSASHQSSPKKSTKHIIFE